MIGCSHTETCKCLVCTRLQTQLKRLAKEPHLKHLESEWSEALLHARDSNSHLPLMLDALTDHISNIEARVGAASTTNTLDPAKDQFFFIDTNGHYWTSIPHAGGWLTAKVTYTGYQNKVFHTHFHSVRQRIASLNVSQDSGQEPMKIIASPKFRILTALNEAYEQWKEGALEKSNYDKIKTQLIDEYYGANCL